MGEEKYFCFSFHLYCIADRKVLQTYTEPVSYGEGYRLCAFKRLALC